MWAARNPQRGQRIPVNRTAAARVAAGDRDMLRTRQELEVRLVGHLRDRGEIVDGGRRFPLRSHAGNLNDNRRRQSYPHITYAA